MLYDSVIDVIGDTPLVRIGGDVTGLRNVDLYAKLEMLNPFGSVKDRAAWSMARAGVDAAREGDKTMIELSSGNTAKALAVIAGMHGVRFRSVTNRMKVPEIKDLLLLIGADIEELPGQAECLDPTDADDPLARIHREISGPGSGYFHTDQYFNARNVDAHVHGTGPEIVADLGGAPAHFIACVGTAGSSTGVAQVLRAQDPDVQVLGLVAHKSDFIPGIRNIDEVHEVGLFDPDTYDTIESVSADEAIEGMLTLVRRCGMLAGPTGGAAYFGAVRYLEKVDAALDGTVPVLLLAFGLGALNTSISRRGEVVMPLSYMTGTLVKIGQGMTLHCAGVSKWSWVPHLTTYTGFMAGAAVGGVSFGSIGAHQALFTVAIGATLIAALTWRLDHRGFTAQDAR
jgi:cysteine synthase